MAERILSEIVWSAAFIGFGVDMVFSQVVGYVVISIMLSLQGISLSGDDLLPTDAELAYQVVGVLGALVGGVVAGYLAKRWGSIHGVLGSLIGLFAIMCALPLLGNPEFSIGDLGFVVLNLIAAGYGGGLGERWHRRRNADSGEGESQP